MTNNSMKNDIDVFAVPPVDPAREAPLLSVVCAHFGFARLHRIAVPSFGSGSGPRLSLVTAPSVSTRR